MPYSSSLWQDPDNPGRGSGFFAQIAGSDGNPNPIGNTRHYWHQQFDAGRPDDRWGIAWCDFLFSRQLKSGLGVIGGALNDERVLEAYYDEAIIEHVRFRPDAQVVWPGSSGRSANLFVGLRVRLVL